MEQIFSIRLKELREDNELSQMELSKKIDIPQATIARYELCKTQPRVDEIIKICNFFNVTSDYLLGLED